MHYSNSDWVYHAIIQCNIIRWYFLSKDINDLNIKIDEINTQIVENEDLIKRLKKKKSEIPTNVNVMDADGVASGISDYLKRRD